jgi:membrane protein DedA with SNARE-associated domain
MIIFDTLLLNIVKSVPALNSVYEYALLQLRDTSMVWLFVAAFLGGLFIIPLASDFLFAYYILVGANPFLTIIVTFIGVMIARAVDFWFGRLFSDYAHKHFIKENAKKFHEKFDKWGSSVLFFGNFVPFFPNELFIVFIGATEYKFKKFLFYHGLSKLLKLILIILLVKMFLYYGWITHRAFGI